MGAAADHREVPGLEPEAVAREQRLLQRSEERRRHLDHITADLADDVLMGVVGQVVHRPPVTEVDVVDDAQVLQVGEGAVDRRPVDVRVAFAYALGEVVGGDVLARAHQLGEQGSPAGRHPTTPLTDQGQESIHAVCGHVDRV